MPEVRWTDNIYDYQCYIDGDSRCVKITYGCLEITYPLDYCINSVIPQG